MRSDGAPCGYCGCLPTHRSKKDAHYTSLTLLVAHRLREQVKAQVQRSGKNPHRRLILCQNPARKHQNMGESGHGSRETIMLVGRR